MYKYYRHNLIEPKSLEIFITVLSGVVVFILSQFVLKLIIEPIVEYKRTIGRIDNKLKFYSNVITNPPLIIQNLSKNYLDAKVLFRDLSCELESNYKVIPMRGLFIRLGLILQKESISKACTGLISISNLTGNKNETGIINVPLLAAEKIDQVRKDLNIQFI